MQGEVQLRLGRKHLEEQENERYRLKPKVSDLTFQGALATSCLQHVQTSFYENLTLAQVFSRYTSLVLFSCSFYRNLERKEEGGV